jgi:hypothetical protein
MPSRDSIAVSGSNLFDGSRETSTIFHEMPVNFILSYSLTASSQKSEKIPDFASRYSQWDRKSAENFMTDS